jgi:hypothetical protein
MTFKKVLHCSITWLSTCGYPGDAQLSAARDEVLQHCITNSNLTRRLLYKDQINSTRR